MIYTAYITRDTQGFSDIHDISDEVEQIVGSSGIQTGIVSVSAVGSTASISTIEYEPALVEDMREWLESQIPASLPTRHGATWGDDNGFSHLRATLMGPSATFSVARGACVRGTWQQIVLIDHDNRARSRKVCVTVVGE